MFPSSRLANQKGDRRGVIPLRTTLALILLSHWCQVGVMGVGVGLRAEQGVGVRGHADELPAL